jgi:hypothetical protein
MIASPETIEDRKFDAGWKVNTIPNGEISLPFPKMDVTRPAPKTTAVTCNSGESS